MTEKMAFALAHVIFFLYFCARKSFYYEEYR